MEGQQSKDGTAGCTGPHQLGTLHRRSRRSRRSEAQLGRRQTQKQKHKQEAVF